MAHLPEWASINWVQRTTELQSELFQRFVEFEGAVCRPGVLSTKFKELMAVGITHVTQRDACVEYHTRRAKQEGASDEEIVEAVFVAMELGAGVTLGHDGASAKAMERQRRGEQKRSTEHRDARPAPSSQRSEP